MKVDRDAFVACYGGVYEHSPWVAERAWDGGIAEAGDLAPVFRRIVDRTGHEAQLALLRAHPDLAGRLAVGGLTAESAAEQAGAGLDQCTEAEFAEFSALNARYVEKFGFPFIVAVRGLDRAAILEAFRKRVEGTPEEEFRTALAQVHRIAALRISEKNVHPEVPRTPVERDDLLRLIGTALARNGASAACATAVAEMTLVAEGDGAHSHGVFRIPGYIAAMKAGAIDGHAAPRFISRQGAVLRYDAMRCAAPYAYDVTLPELARLTQELGVGVLSLANVAHFQAMWPETEWLAEQGLVGFACTANLPYLAPAGGTRPVFGTNPLAFAVPGNPPVAIDMASSTMARGDIMLAAREGRSVADGVGLGPDGLPTSDPAEILKGAQLPFGGHKGSAIALMVELLAGLCGGPYSDVAEDTSKVGLPVGAVFVMALSPEALGGEGALAEAQAFVERLRKVPGVRLPGARRHINRRKPGPLMVENKILAEVRALAGLD
ncbi:2-oxo-4-hydroxy-4-carboxy-5-ureidoimidazoline decarboxylase [Acuticoccus sediminis]|uniref:2-oxo-4-hydroxy-4-carboxy-5-ureidoimidazoline decarboxylase n=1 Tax=Acuticoccus sediminis TaxID=2184697 RepID=A0A8B2NWR1_9HYPH|nr:2-oxo-4-hydroxy-4-carboxy-5-ureidoimidazoline decarboxylase [Acuticoccus sediminis]RAI03281.1 2-oxo-4-hydroxy-4-carboxy-5-ureidoimidazoline decarboxylase [Acuticoccus sediminis]